MDLQFFEQGRSYIIKMLEEEYFKENFFLNEYFYGIPMARAQVIEYYKNYSFEAFLSRLDFCCREAR